MTHFSVQIYFRANAKLIGFSVSSTRTSSICSAVRWIWIFSLSFFAYRRINCNKWKWKRFRWLKDDEISQRAYKRQARDQINDFGCIRSSVKFISNEIDERCVWIRCRVECLDLSTIKTNILSIYRDAQKTHNTFAHSKRCNKNVWQWQRVRTTPKPTTATENTKLHAHRQSSSVVDGVTIVCAMRFRPKGRRQRLLY